MQKKYFLPLYKFETSSFASMTEKEIAAQSFFERKAVRSEMGKDQFRQTCIVPVFIGHLIFATVFKPYSRSTLLSPLLFRAIVKKKPEKGLLQKEREGREMEGCKKGPASVGIAPKCFFFEAAVYLAREKKCTKPYQCFFCFEKNNPTHFLDI